MVCAQDASGDVSAAAAAGSQSWHSKPIRASRCAEGPGGLTGEVAATHTHIQTHTNAAPMGGRALAERRSHGDWVTAELDQSCGNQHLVRHTHTYTHTRVHTWLSTHIRSCAMYTNTLWWIVARTRINVNGCRC